MLRRIALAFGLFVGAGAHAGGTSHHWSYQGRTGPSHWADLNSKFAACGTGMAQSPINIRTDAAQTQNLPPLKFDYRPTPLHIIDNGHSIQVDVDPGNWLRIGTHSYELVQFHFHRPSEEWINGKAADMVAHLVHRDASRKLAVVAVLLNAGKPNAMVETLWNHVPGATGHPAYFKGVLINPSALLPPKLSYFTYMGSLTTPPCSEGVRWFILRSASSLSKAQIMAFAAHYRNDARPIQWLNGRRVFATN